MGCVRFLALACSATMILFGRPTTLAHEGHSHLRLADVRLANQSAVQQDRDAASQTIPAGRSSLGGPTVNAFRPFASTVSARVEGQRLVVESNGLPEHGMMVGIRAWQQQVPLPQPFTGENAWRLPLSPRPAAEPISVLVEPLRGAIALAVNGVPIFCALNNRGEDTFLVGELDEWGGHCGRGDDYHYHIAPIHLESQVGVGNPIAFALDGYPILGLTEADGSVPDDLDPFNGHTHDGHYHYHASETFPYINGGLHGVVTMEGDQVKQPKDSPVRPGQSPLRGAVITGFERQGDGFDLTYEVNGKEAHVRYTLLDSDRVEFTQVSTSGDSSTNVYQRGKPGGGFNRFYLWCGILVALAFFGLLGVIRRKKRLV